MCFMQPLMHHDLLLDCIEPYWNTDHEGRVKSLLVGQLFDSVAWHAFLKGWGKSLKTSHLRSRFSAKRPGSFI